VKNTYKVQIWVHAEGESVREVEEQLRTHLGEAEVVSFADEPMADLILPSEVKTEAAKMIVAMLKEDVPKDLWQEMIIGHLVKCHKYQSKQARFRPNSSKVTIETTPSSKGIRGDAQEVFDRIYQECLVFTGRKEKWDSSKATSCAKQ
jgi:hypothetical protein